MRPFNSIARVRSEAKGVPHLEELRALELHKVIGWFHLGNMPISAYAV
jgi:hypothetical protein